MARGRGQQMRSGGDEATGEVQVCPLCIEPLDADEQQFYPCPCGYQVCVFCHKKIELFCNNLCPGCRTEYGTQKDLFDPASRQSSNDMVHPAPATPVKHTLPHSLVDQTPHTGSKGGILQQAGAAGWPPLWGASADRPSPSVLASQSPAEGAWPSLTASQRPVQAANASTANPAQSQVLQHQADSLSPAWQGQHAEQPQGQGAATRVALAGPLTAGQVPSVQADPDGAALLQKVQSAVGNGDLSMEEGTKQLVAFLRQREQSGKGKAGVHTPKPPPGFATAAKQPVPQQLDPVSSSQSESSASSSLLPFPAMQPNSFSTPPQPALLTPSAQALPSTEAAGSMNPLQWSASNVAPAYQQWGYSQAADSQSSSSQVLANSSGIVGPASSSMPSTAGIFPVDLVAASAALWAAAPATGSNQLQSLTSFGNQLLAPRKRRGPLYLRTGPSNTKAAKENGLSQPPGFGGPSDSKASQQMHWQTLGNGNFSDHFTNSPQNRNGFNTNGLQSSLFAGAHAAAMGGDEQQRQAQAYSNTLPANGSLFSHSS